MSESNLKLNDDTASNAGENELRKYTEFSQSFATKLSSIEQALGNLNKDAWNHSLDACKFSTRSKEKASLTDLISTENKILNKVMMALVSLCTEVNQLQEEAENDFYDPLLFYGEGVEDSVEGDTQVQLGRMMPIFQRLLCFVVRIREVLKNILQQVAALYNKTLPKVIDTNSIRLDDIYACIGGLLEIAITLDEIILGNSTLKDHWTQYTRMIVSVYNNPTRFDVDKDKIKPLEKVIGKIEKVVLSGNIFQHCLNQNFDDSGIPVHKNTLLADVFQAAIKSLFNEMDSKPADVFEASDYKFYTTICSLQILHFQIYRMADKKFLKQLWEFQKKVPCVTLAPNVVWMADNYLLKIPTALKIFDKRSQDAVHEMRNNYIASKQQSLQKDFKAYFMSVSLWMVRMESIHLQEKSLDDVMARTDVFIEGISLIKMLKNLVTTIMNLHVYLQKPMSKTEVLMLIKICCLIKSIEACFHKCSVQLCESELNIVQNIQFQLLKKINEIKKRIVSDKKYSDRRLDILTAIILAGNSINGPATLQRLIITKLSLAFANQLKTFRDDEFQAIHALLRVYEIMCIGIGQSVHESANLSFFYWHKDLLNVYFNNICSDPCEASSLQNVFSVLNDVAPHLLQSVHFESSSQLLDIFSNSIMAAYKQHLLTKICKEIENDLRLSVHRHLKLNDRNPFRIGLKGLRLLLATKPVQLLGSYFHIKAQVTHYLDVAFYNLTTVALHDWKTYGQMRNIAEQKYQITMQEVNLPNQTLEQGLDILEIMRNIHVFVSKYLYNLNNQIFVERSSNNKHLNTINIRHIANSIRTHGTGILNTTVNFTFQFLKKKFYVFSQFLYDEHIKSRLIKDIRYFRENKESLNQRYPYNRADRFNKGIRKLGLTNDGQSYLDKFRLLISHIGNAMGYIRMVRSGNLHFCSNAICFVPDIEDIVNFHELVKQENLGEQVNDAVEQLDNVIDMLAKNSAEGSDYFKMLVEVFAPEFRTQKNLHLRNFYAILPPLTLNFVEYSISCKEKMNKKNKVGAAFTDDGFAMGVAYILKLLDQYNEFDTLHWFQSVHQKHEEDARSQAGRKTGKQPNEMQDEKLSQATSLAYKRIEIYRREFDLLYYSLSSARIFFQADSKSDESSSATTNDNTTSEKPSGSEKKKETS